MKEYISGGIFNDYVDGYCDIVGGTFNKKWNIADYKNDFKVHDFTYTGSLARPYVSPDNGYTDFDFLHWDASYSGTKVGKGTVTVKGCHNYGGSFAKTFKIIPKGTSISSLTKGSKKFTVKWRKQSTQTTGYQVRTYKTVSGTKYYSKWSATKSVKTK